jgi:ribonucleoside-diphosphate reductase alpha chain
VYVTGSREKVVLETHATAKQKEAPTDMTALWEKTKKPRPRSLRGYTYTVETPVGKAFITINQNGDDQPFEVFLNTAKAGSETAAVSEAIGRLMSYILRLSSPVIQRDRMWEIHRQLKGIGGPRSKGFGPNRVTSLPDGVSQVLKEYLDSTEPGAAHAAEEPANGNPAKEDNPVPEKRRFGDICPECGHASLVNEEGCRKCYSCGFSEC